MTIIRLPYLKKLWRDQRYVLLILVLFMTLFEYLYAWIFFKSPVSSFIEAYFKFLPTEITSFLGVQAGTAYYHAQVIAFGYIHPLILISFSFFPVSLPSRYVSGEIESRNFDIFFSRPVHRSVVPTHLFIFMVFASVLSGMGIFTGTMIANLQFSLALPIYDYAKVTVTAVFFFTSLATLSLTLASFQNDRGKALSRIIGLFIFFYFYDTITRLDDTLKPFYTFSYFKLYRPAEIIMHKVSIIPPILILLLITVLFLSAAVICFNRRDL